MSFLTNPPPPSLKPVSHYLKIALEHDNRDKVIAYWARFAAVQKCLTLDKSSPEAKSFVISLLTWLESSKKELSSNEAITVEAAGEAHLENYALKLFNFADQSDRNAVFNKNVVKSFYTSSILFDILESLRPPLSEEFTSARKYAKWRAAYIHNCLKNGETPVPGSGGSQQDPDIADDGEEEEEDRTTTAAAQNDSSQYNNYGFVKPPTASNNEFPFPTNDPPHPPSYHPSHQPPPPTTSYLGYEQQGGGPAASMTSSSSSQQNQSLSVEQIAKAQKYCKWASSALNFDDVASAIENLEKALALLKTGQDLG